MLRPFSRKSCVPGAATLKFKFSWIFNDTIENVIWHLIFSLPVGEEVFPCSRMIHVLCLLVNIKERQDMLSIFQEWNIVQHSLYLLSKTADGSRMPSIIDTYNVYFNRALILSLNAVSKYFILKVFIFSIHELTWILDYSIIHSIIGDFLNALIMTNITYRTVYQMPCKLADTNSWAHS